VFKRHRSGAPWREGDGLISYVLPHAGEPPETQLTWVDVGPGSGRRLHGHAPEQVYAVGRGRGDWEAFYDTGPPQPGPERGRGCTGE
jgi:hypothetical protein